MYTSATVALVAFLLLGIHVARYIPYSDFKLLSASVSTYLTALLVIYGDHEIVTIN